MSFDYFKNPAPSSAALLGLGERGLLTASLDSRLPECCTPPAICPPPLLIPTVQTGKLRHESPQGQDQGLNRAL